MLDFKELDVNGKEFELLIRELLFLKGLDVYWSGVGPDGGRDLVCVETMKSVFSNEKKTWLIQCKHNAHSENSVGIGAIDGLFDACSQHSATGYILVCSTQPSSSVVDRLEAITKNPSNSISAIYWDYVQIERLLSTPKLWRIAQRFFPVSADASSWNVYATEDPSRWVVNYKGYYFHLTNRVGSRHDYQFSSISERIAEIDAIDTAEDHFLRVRTVYYDDKNGHYSWYVDYMYPNGEQPTYAPLELKNMLGDENVHNDGQFYTYHIAFRTYLKHSDHYDPDHSDYYIDQNSKNPYSYGKSGNWDHYQLDMDFEKKLEEIRVHSFNSLVKAFEKLTIAELVRSTNANIESINKFYSRRDWLEIIEENEINSDRFFSAWFIFNVKDVKEFFSLVSTFPQLQSCNFRLTKVFVFVPNLDSGGSTLDTTDQEEMYELTITLTPDVLHNKEFARKNLNQYFKQVITCINQYIA